MLRIYKCAITIILMMFICSVGYSQQTTKTDLFKLFYQANQSVKNGENDDAKRIYTEIIKLSPGLPDPYLNLGKLYSMDVDSEENLKKACICFSQYLKLNPETKQSDYLNGEISRLTSLINNLKSSKKVVVLQSDTMPKNKFYKLEVTPKLSIVEDTIDNSILLPKVIHKKDTSFVIEPDQKYIGRWISSEFGNNGREMWILDIVEEDGKMAMCFNNNSYFKSMKGLCKLTGTEKAFAVNNNDSICFSFLVKDYRNDKISDTSSDLNFDSVVRELFGLDFDSSDTQYIGTETANKQIFNYTYLFNLILKNNSFIGTQRTIITDSSNEIISDVSDNISLYKCSNDYNGFTNNISDINELYHCNELVTLYNEKLLEASDKISSLNDLGCMCLTGIGTNRNAKMAVAYFMEASMKNNLFAMLNLARLYSIGIGVDKDLNKARELYTKAFEAGYTDAMVYCGDTYWANNSIESSPDYKSALICYSKATARRSPLAFYRMAWLYQEGLGVEKDENKSKEYYLLAKDMNYPDALADVGIYYRDGILFDADVNKSIELLTSAANKGNSRAMYELSQMYLKGDLLRSDLNKSLEWRKKYLDADLLYFDWYCNVKQYIYNVLKQKVNENDL